MTSRFREYLRRLFARKLLRNCYKAQKLLRIIVTGKSRDDGHKEMTGY